MRTDVKKRPVLVTGAAGFIGSHLVRRLLRDGALVHALDLPGADWWRMPPGEGSLTCLECDLLDGDAVLSCLAGIKPEKIYHLASNTDVSRGFETLDNSLSDLSAAMNLLRCVKDSPCDCFVQTGTCEEYGDNPVPFREDQVCNPVSPYSASKASATLFCRMYARTLGLPVVVVRPFLTYGPMQGENRFIPSAITAALEEREFPMTGGKQTREFNYVDDIVDGFVRASTSERALGEVINIGNGAEYSLRHLVETISRLAGTPLKAEFGALPYRDGEAWHFYCDNTKARQLLDWAPAIDLETGLKQTIDWYREHTNGEGS